MHSYMLHAWNNVASLPFRSWWQLIPQMVPYPFLRYLNICYYFDKARPKALAGVLKWFSRPYHLKVFLHCSVICHVMDSPPQYHMFMVHLGETHWLSQLFSLIGFLNTAEVLYLLFHQGYDLQLINNGQAANNRIPVIRILEHTVDWWSGAVCMQLQPRTCLQVRLLTLNFSVFNSRRVCLQGTGCVAPRRDLCNYECKGGCWQNESKVTFSISFILFLCSLSLKMDYFEILICHCQINSNTFGTAALIK